MPIPESKKEAMMNLQQKLIRETIIAEARAWIGTPYHHQAALKGVGCDCLGQILVLKVRGGTAAPVARRLAQGLWR